MRAAQKDPGEWKDGFLFVGNRPILDFLNTSPVLAQGPTELLPDFEALVRWLVASETVKSTKTKSLIRSWNKSPQAAAFLKELIAFRERLRDAVLRMENGSGAPDDFVKEVNARLADYPPRAALRKRDGRLVMELLLDPQKPADLWAVFIHGAADLLTEIETGRLRRCESCVLHFYDTSKKGSRRWCSMNICGNKIKVATYRRRKREGHAD
jgi:predicted RNA-binding Zn ribbon-like protein